MSLVDLIDNTKSDKNTIHSYLPLYQTLLISKKETAKHVLEVGIYQGGSIRLWADFFTNAMVYGVDINDSDLKHDRIRVFKTDAYSPDFVDTLPLLDFMLDDGPHTLQSMKQFIKLYSSHMTDDGILIIEDVQDWSWIELLKQEVPEPLKRFIQVYDLRENKNRYDDIVFTIQKNSTIL